MLLIVLVIVATVIDRKALRQKLESTLKQAEV